jgi:hypothetical protein
MASPRLVPGEPTGGEKQFGPPTRSPSPTRLPGAGPPVLFDQPGLSRSAVDRFPPDSTGAIGPAHYVEIVNFTIAVYDRATLRLIASAPLFGGFTSRGFIDPQIEWDEQAQRWFYLGIGPPTQDFNFTLSYGWSKSADPSDVDTEDGTSGWCQYLLPSTTSHDQFLIDDYPKLGHSDNHLIFGSNMFSGPFLSFDHGARIWALPKPTNGDTTCPPAPVATSFGSQFDPLKTADGHRAATPVPANTIDAAPDGYVVAADSPFIVNEGGSASQIMAWRVSGPRESPVLVEDGNMNVASYTGAQDLPQPGTPDKLDNFPDGRLTQAVMSADPDAGGAKAVWTQHTVGGPGGRSEVRWYELLPATRAVRQQGTVASPVDYVFNGAISPSRKGDEAAINYNIASSTQVPQIATRSRRSNTPLGEMSGETLLGTSPQPYFCGGQGAICRWGDYAGASPDPDMAHAVWGTNMLAGPPTISDNWATRNFAVSVKRSHGPR